MAYINFKEEKAKGKVQLDKRKKKFYINLY